MGDPKEKGRPQAGLRVLKARGLGEVQLQTRPCIHGSNQALETTPQTGQYGRKIEKGETASQIKGFKHPEGG